MAITSFCCVILILLVFRYILYLRYFPYYSPFIIYVIEYVRSTTFCVGPTHMVCEASVDGVRPVFARASEVR